MKRTKFIIASLAALSFSAFANTSVTTGSTSQNNNICVKNQQECVKRYSAAQCAKVEKSCTERLAKREQTLRAAQQQNPQTQPTIKTQQQQQVQQQTN